MNVRKTLSLAIACTIGTTGWSATGDERAVLDEIIVTAQKREESLQETPLSVTALTTDMIEKIGITSIADISMLVPAFSFSGGMLSGTEGRITIRGIGSPAEEQSTIDSTIGVYMDGVYIARQTLMLMDVVDLARVEVLRGPQGTLFGRNTTGGAVNLIARPPSEEFEFNETASLSKWSGRSSRTTIHSGDLLDGVLRTSLSYMHAQRDGVVDNRDVSSNRDPGAYRNDIARFAVRLLPTDRLTIDYSFDWLNLRNVASAFQLYAAAPHVQEYLESSVMYGGDMPMISRKRQSHLSLGDRNKEITTRVEGHALVINYDFESSTLKSITSYREDRDKKPAWSMSGFGSGVVGLMLDPETFDFLGVEPVHLYDGGPSVNRGHQFQQEFTLMSSGSGPWQWAAGVFYFRETSSTFDPQFFTYILPAELPDMPVPMGLPLGVVTDYSSESKSTAIYGQVTYRPSSLDDRLGITVGTRYSRDQRDLSQTEPMIQNRHATFSEPTGHVSLDYRFTDDINGYLRVSHGYRSGGFNIRVLQKEFEPETIDQVEIGVKSDWLQKRLRVNAAVYASRYKDRQITRFDTDLNGGAATIIENAGKSDYFGGEFEITALPFDGLQITASFSHVDIELKEVRAADGTNIAREYHAVTEGPEVTAQIAMEYLFPFRLGGGEVSARVDWAHESGYYFFLRDDENPFTHQISRGSTDRVNARLRWDGVDLGASQWQLSVSLWGKNLTNDIYHARGIDFGELGYAGVIFSEPRSYGMDFSLKF